MFYTIYIDTSEEPITFTHLTSEVDRLINEYLEESNVIKVWVVTQKDNNNKPVLIFDTDSDKLNRYTQCEFCDNYHLEDHSFSCDFCSNHTCSKCVHVMGKAGDSQDEICSKCYVDIDG